MKPVLFAKKNTLVVSTEEVVFRQNSPKMIESDPVMNRGYLL